MSSSSKVSPAAPYPWWQRLAHLSAGGRLESGLLVSAGVALALPRTFTPEVRAVAAWDAFAVFSVALIWIAILTAHPDQIRAIARRSDPGRVVTFALVLLGALASLLAVITLLHASRELPMMGRFANAMLALTAVVMAWVLIHTVFTLRYAHHYYGDSGDQPCLAFPAGFSTPDYFDFAYFAFTIGMAVQTADVSIQSRALRRLTLLHAVFSFAFNTAVVALSISAIATLL